MTTWLRRVLLIAVTLPAVPVLAARLRHRHRLLDPRRTPATL
ncbi:hypothetical protein ACFXGT_23970 [Streptomyces sp. NPDC059352]